MAYISSRVIILSMVLTLSSQMALAVGWLGSKPCVEPLKALAGDQFDPIYDQAQARTEEISKQKSQKSIEDEKRSRENEQDIIDEADEPIFHKISLNAPSPTSLSRPKGSPSIFSFRNSWPVVTLLDPKTGLEAGSITFDVEEFSPTNIQVTPNGRHALFWSNLGNRHALVDFKNLRQSSGSRPTPTFSARYSALSLDGTHHLQVVGETDVLVWHRDPEGKDLFALRGLTVGVFDGLSKYLHSGNDLKLSSSGALLAVARKGYDLEILATDGPDELRVVAKISGLSDTPEYMDFSSDEKKLYVWIRGRLATVDIAKGSFTPGTFGDFRFLGSSSAQKIILFENQKKELSVFDCADGKTLVKFNSRNINAKLSPDGKYLMLLESESIRLWDVKSGKELDPLKFEKWWLYSAEFDGDSQSILIRSDQGSKRVVFRRGGL